MLSFHYRCTRCQSVISGSLVVKAKLKHHGDRALGRKVEAITVGQLANVPPIDSLLLADSLN